MVSKHNSSIMVPPVVVLLLGLLSSVNSLPPPRTSFLLNSADRPLVHFSPPNVHNATTLLLSDDGSTLYVGARDAVLSLDVSQSDVINLKRKVDWSPSESEINNCKIKGKNPQVDCPNFVRVLQFINSTHLYACGSYAYSPQDAYIDAESFAMVQRDSAKGRCPFSPFQRNTAITIDGELFTATTTDFRGDKPQISRHFSKDGRPDVIQDAVSLLDEPVFVRSSFNPADGKLYFFFSEVGKEFSYVDELRVSRVAQVCKDDVGGQRTLQKKWTSFAKAPLLCRSLKQLPFSILQDVSPLEPQEDTNTSETLFYGVFTSQWSSHPESAICVFRLQDIRAAFIGGYRTLEMQHHQWNQQGRHLGQCGLHNATDAELAEAKTNFLTSSIVKPVGNKPVVVSSEQRYTRVAAMRSKAADGKQYTVLFLLTESGFLHKVVLLDGGARVIEEIQVFTQPQQVKSIILSTSKGVLYVGTSEGVTAVPVASCSIYRTCSQCVLARDPLCGWSSTRRTCSSLDASPETLAQDLENGNVEEKCQRQARTRLDTEVSVSLNEAVRLQCVKPSNLATLNWTSPQFNTDREKLFIRSADNSLIFFATNATLGTYRCEAEEGGYAEIVASYVVRLSFSPRSKSPHDVTNKHDVPSDQEEPYEDIVISTTPSVEPIENSTEDPKHDQVMLSFTDEPDILKHHSGSKTSIHQDITSKTNVQSRMEPPGEARQLKSYYSELVVVSLLLVICICCLVLGALYMWWSNKTGLKRKPLVCPQDDGKENKSMETVPSLSSPEDAVPDVKVVDK